MTSVETATQSTSTGSIVKPTSAAGTAPSVGPRIGIASNRPAITASATACGSPMTVYATKARPPTAPHRMSCPRTNAASLVVAASTSSAASPRRSSGTARRSERTVRSPLTVQAKLATRMPAPMRSAEPSRPSPASASDSESSDAPRPRSIFSGSAPAIL